MQQHESICFSCTDIFDSNKTTDFVRDPLDPEHQKDPDKFLKDFLNHLLRMAEKQSVVMRKRLAPLFALLDEWEDSFLEQQKPSLAKRIATIRRRLEKHSDQLVVIGFNSSRFVSFLAKVNI